MSESTTPAAGTNDRPVSQPQGRLPHGEGWQCAECGDYYPRSRIKDVGGEYYCRDGMGHNAPAPGHQQPSRRHR